MRNVIIHLLKYKRKYEKILKHYIGYFWMNYLFNKNILHRKQDMTVFYLFVHDNASKLYCIWHWQSLLHSTVRIFLKGQVTQKWTLSHNLLTLMLYQMYSTSLLHLNTKYFL